MKSMNEELGMRNGKLKWRSQATIFSSPLPGKRSLSSNTSTPEGEGDPLTRHLQKPSPFGASSARETAQCAVSSETGLVGPWTGGLAQQGRKRSFSIRCASLALLLVLLALSLAACHGNRSRNDFAVPQAFDTSRQFEITFWAKNDTNKTQTAIYKKAIDDFHALYPNITVKMKLYTDYGRIYNDVITNIATDTTPNVCITYPDHIATYLTGSNVVVPLDALLNDPAYGLGGSALAWDGPTRDEIIPQFLKECTFSGGVYALPYMRSTEALYINRDYVEALGYTLPDGRTLNVLGEGRLVNLACGMGHPAEIMDMSFSVQALSLKWLAEHRDELTLKVYNVPDSIDDEIGRYKLAAMGLSIDTLTAEQEAYLNGWTAE